MDSREFTEDELKWIKSFERVMKKAPSSLFMYVGMGIDVYPKSPDNTRYYSDGAPDADVKHVSVITNIDFDGGDY